MTLVQSIEQRSLVTRVCPLCGATTLLDFLSMEGVPVSVGILWPTQEKARQALTGNIRLAYCCQCGFIYNRTFEPDKLIYIPGYEISLHHSPLYNQFIQEVAAQLIERYDVRKKSVIEIGCGKGIFLRALCELGANDGYGFDPALEQESVETVGVGRMALIRDYYTKQYASLPHNLVCCRHVLNQIANPSNFLTALQRLLGHQAETIVYFEIPNANYTFGSEATWNVFYERHAYFTTETFAQMFTNCGFEILRAGPCYADDQYLSIEATPGLAPKMSSPASQPVASALPAGLVAYAERYQQRLVSWTARFKAIKQAGQRVIAWGAGGQGITFLNLLKTSKQVPFIVDINPERQGKFVPGSAQRVVGPEFLHNYRPDVVLITNPTYENEIRQQVAGMGLTCEFLVT
jgi:hypothetical protein